MGMEEVVEEDTEVGVEVVVGVMDVTVTVVMDVTVVVVTGIEVMVVEEIETKEGVEEVADVIAVTPENVVAPAVTPVAEGIEGQAGLGPGHSGGHDGRRTFWTCSDFHKQVFS